MFSGPLPPQDFNLARYCLQQSATATPEKTALIIVDGSIHSFESQKLSFVEMESRVLRFAEALRQTGLESGDRIAIRLNSSLDYALCFLAANAAGYVPVPLSPQLTAREADDIVADCGASLVLQDPDLPLGPVREDCQIIPADRLDEMKGSPATRYESTKADDPAYLIYTSGTSGRPKGVLHAQRAAWGRKPLYDDWYGIIPQDVMLHTGALNWTYTLGTGLFDPWINGATSLVYVGEPDINVWSKLINIFGVTLLASSPALYRRMLKYCDLDQIRHSELRHALCAGDALPASIAEAWRAQTGLEIYEAIGMSEVSTFISSSANSPSRKGAVGKPQSGRCIRILSEDGNHAALENGNEGLLAVHRSDPGLMLGYWNRPKEQENVFRGDWFITGDRGLLDDDGYFIHLGRADDVLNASGFRVAPQEIEQVMLQCPGVHEAAATSVELAENLEGICARIVLQPHALLDEEQIINFAKKHLAGYKVPKKITFHDQLPRTPNGKLDRKALRSLG